MIFRAKKSPECADTSGTMNFTGSLVRPLSTLATGAVVVAWALTWLTPANSGNAGQSQPTLEGPVVTRQPLSASEKDSPLKAQRQALRQMGRKLAAPEAPEKWAAPQLLARSP